MKNRAKSAGCGEFEIHLKTTLLFGIFLLLNACTATYYDPVPPADVPANVTRYDSPLSMENSYRRLYARLRECVSTFYHVQPRYDHELSKASVMVVQGLGLNRYSVLGNSCKARFDVHPAGAGSQVEITSVDESLGSLIAASRNWLVRDTQGCAVEG